MSRCQAVKWAGEVRHGCERAGAQPNAWAPTGDAGSCKQWDIWQDSVALFGRETCQGLGALCVSD